MESLLQDLRFALRSLRRSPGFTGVVVAVMALGIGVNVTCFGMVYGVLLRPWPLPQADRVLTLRQTNTARGWDNQEVAWATFKDLRERSRSYSSMGAYWEVNGIATIDRDPERLHGACITSGVFPTLGVQPVLGRNFTRDEEAWNHNWSSVLISDRIWRTRYGGSPSVLGRSLRINGRVRTIVGVMPKDMRFPELADFWIPNADDPSDQNRAEGSLDVIGRLAPGVTVAQARAEARTLWSAMVKDHADMKDSGVRVVTIREQWGRYVRPFMIVMLFAVLFVLLIACANVANLLLVRAAARRREISLRTALGATRGRIVRQLLTESVLLSLTGGLLGIALGQWGIRLMLLGIPTEVPWFMKFDIDAPVLAYTAAIAVLAGIVFGLAPALHASDENLTEALREGGAQAGQSRSSHRLRNTLVVAEVAFSIVLLIGAGLMIRTFMKYDQAGRRLRTEGIVAGRVLLPVALFPNREGRAQFFREVQRRLEAEPGVIAATGMNDLPLGRDNWTRTVSTPETHDERRAPEVSFWTVLPGALRMTGIGLRKGREFTVQDDSLGQRVVLVSERAAQRLFPGRDPIGQRLHFPGQDSTSWRTVVGVTDDVEQSVESTDRSVGSVWAPQLQEALQSQWLIVETRAGGASAASALRRVVKALHPDIAVYEIRTMREQLRFALWVRRLFASLIGVFGALALVIAAVGLYGVMAYSVAQRTHEIGIRMALGAEARSVVRLVVGQAFRLTLAGTLLGLAAALGVTRFMTATIAGVSPTDPPTFVTVTLLLALSGLLAAWVPAWRATRVHPMQALRSY